MATVTVLIGEADVDVDVEVVGTVEDRAIGRTHVRVRRAMTSLMRKISLSQVLIKRSRQTYLVHRNRSLLPQTILPLVLHLLMRSSAHGQPLALIRRHMTGLMTKMRTLMMDQ